MGGVLQRWGDAGWRRRAAGAEAADKKCGGKKEMKTKSIVSVARRSPN